MISFTLLLFKLSVSEPLTVSRTTLSDFVQHYDDLHLKCPFLLILLITVKLAKLFLTAIVCC